MYFVRRKEEDLSLSRDKWGKEKILINPMATDPWGSVYPKSTLFQEDTSQEVICDADVVSPRRSGRFVLSKTSVLIIISIIYLAIIGALVLILVLLLPSHNSSWYHVEGSQTFKSVTKNSYPSQTDGISVNVEIADHPPIRPPRPQDVDASKKKLPLRPSPVDPLHSWYDKMIPRSDIHRSPFKTSPPQTSTSPGSSTQVDVDHVDISSTTSDSNGKLPTSASTAEPRARINHRFLNQF